MASIQQSLNQLLGATAGVATAGTYMYRQTPTYKAQQLEQSAEKLMKYELEQTGEKTGEAYEEARKLEVEAAKIAPTKKRVARASEIWEERAEEAAIEARQKAKAEQAGLNRVAQSAETQTTQRQALKDRFDFLKSFSAKERGQFETAYNRHKNKGEID